MGEIEQLNAIKASGMTIKAIARKLDIPHTKLLKLREAKYIVDEHGEKISKFYAELQKAGLI